MADEELQGLIRTLKGMKSGTAFTPYIDYIVFPKYRRITPGQRITFDFPLTVLVGRNGAGKSSILHALAGAPKGRSVGRYWFGTKVDPIEERTAGGGKGKLGDSEQACFWYGYRHEGEEKQAIKQRVHMPSDPDYWEPTRLIKKYGMTAALPEGQDRYDQITMAVEHLNLRLFLSAFDKCFRFISTQTLNAFRTSRAWSRAVKEAEEQAMARKKGKGKLRGVRKTPNEVDYIRHRAKGLDKALAMAEGYSRGKNQIAKPREVLSRETLSVVSRIVGKEYTEGWIIEHRFYESWGTSVRFVTSSGRYTEANAGSGETAVVMIVRLFEAAADHSLLLLDEPETSLHPGAQAQLLKYILGQIKKKKLQVVISTHAPAFVRHLPKEAIKVLQPTADGYVNVIENVTWEDAFHEIGQEFDPNCNIVVEDRLAKAILDAVAATRGPSFAARVKVRFGPGGDGAMKRDAAVFIKDPAKTPIMIFDGDKEHVHQDPKKLTQEQLTPDKLDKIIKDQVGMPISFAEDSNMAPAKKVDIRIAYLSYFLNKVFYLPFESPEEALWSDDAARAHLTAADADEMVEPTMKQLASETAFKQKFAKLAEALGALICTYRTCIQCS